jgi:hypothetical protein
VNSPTLCVPQGTGQKAASLEGDERWALALRVAQSSEFQKSTRLREFLLYVCEKTLTNRRDEVHEQQIGIEVFGRRPDYNPAEDNIVRVEARELRKRLDRYFSTEGQGEPLRIRIPKGSYVPCFEPNNGHGNAGSPWPVSGGATVTTQGTALNSQTKEGLAFGRIPWSTLALAVLVAILLAAHLTEWGGKDAAAERSFMGIPSNGEASGIWPALFPSPRPVEIVAADSSLVLTQDITGQIVPLADYFSRRYANELRGPEVPLIVSRPYTSLADVLVTSEILQAALARQRRILVRYARDLQMRDLENNNLIFLGSAYSDPWIREFDAEREFGLGVDGPSRRLYFFNKSPQTGETERYYSGGRGGNTDETYGLVTFLPNLRNSGNVLILEGTNSEGTEAAGDFITDPHYASNLRQYLGSGKGNPLPYFQLLLKTTALDGAPSKLQVIAHRTITPLQP